MFLSKKSYLCAGVFTTLTVSSLFFTTPAQAQGGSPAPGGYAPAGAPMPNGGAPVPNGAPVPSGRGMSAPAAPMPGGGSAPVWTPPNRAGGVSAPAPGSRYAAPAPGNMPAMAAPQSEYAKLPINAVLAAQRLEELRNLMTTTNPKSFSDLIGDQIDWLSDMADAHWRIHQAFAKVDTMKAQSEAERQACLKFGALKRQAMLLKAEFLVQQRRYPEAIGPLVEIVAAEPKTETGQSAYRLLKEIGFSDEVQPRTETVNVAPTQAKPL